MEGVPTSASRFSEELAWLLLAEARWGFREDGPQPTCWHCGADRPYRFKGRRLFKCRSCRRQFTVTTGTKFDRHKLSAEQIVRAILWWEESGGEASAASLGRLIGISYKAAYVLKLRLFEYAKDGPEGKSVIAFGYLSGFTRFILRDGDLFKERRTDGATIRHPA